LTTTLLVYLRPSFADMPSFEVDHVYTPSTFTPLGMQDVSEAGAIGRRWRSETPSPTPSDGWYPRHTSDLGVKRLTETAPSDTHHANVPIPGSILSDFWIHATDVVEGMQGGAS
jgi:hypothetical protein